MPMPKYNEMYQPILELMADGNAHKLTELYRAVAKWFHLTDEECAEQLPSGQPILKNRVGWAKTYLKKAGLIVNEKRGSVVLSPEGMKVQAQGSGQVNNQFLMKYSGFQAFQNVSRNQHHADSDGPELGDQQAQTPDDLMEEAFQRINSTLVDEVLSEVVKMSPAAFERFALRLLQKMGYGTFDDAARTTALSSDEGIDGILMEDKLGFSLIYIQAKKWDIDSSVGRPEIQAFVGAISGRGGKGLFVTTARFSKKAREYANQQHIILVDGEKLAKLMIEHNFCVSVKRNYEIKAINNDELNEFLD